VATEDPASAQLARRNRSTGDSAISTTDLPDGQIGSLAQDAERLSEPETLDVACA